MPTHYDLTARHCIWTLDYSGPVLTLYRSGILFARYFNEECDFRSARRLASKWNFPVYLVG